MKYRLVIITAPSQRVAHKLVHDLLRKRLIACANIIPRVESHFWWKGHMEKAREILILAKTTARRFSLLKKRVEKLHPYDVPEILSFEVKAGNAAYLKWLEESCRSVD